MLNSRRTQSHWLGISFLILAGIIATATAVLAITGYSLTDIGAGFGGGSDQGQQPSLTQAEMTATAGPVQTPTPTLSLPPIPEDIELSAQAAFVVHLEENRVLYEKNADEPIQPASTTKIITALTTLRHAEPTEVIEITPEDVVDPVAESSMGLQAGDEVTVHDLIVGLMLPSGNDAANALARVIGARLPAEDGIDPVTRFVQEMNIVADEIGMEVSNLQHAAGHDRDNQAVTAREMALAARALLDSPSLVPIVAMRRAEIRVGGDNARVMTVENTNELLVFDGIFGIKTGTTEEAQQALVAAWRDDTSTVVAVILGSQDRYGDARALLELGNPPEPNPDLELPDETPEAELQPGS